MKPSIQKLISVFLGLIILVSSTGVVLASHSCFSKPGTDVSLFSHKGCCSKGKMNCHADPQKETSFSKKCCQLKITFHKVDVSSILLKSNLVQADCLPLAFSTIDFSFTNNFSETRLLNKAPPKPAGRELLTAISLLQI